jgi:hypothetical protein
MGHSNSLEVLSYGQTSSSDTAVTTANALVLIKVGLSGNKPKFVYIQATQSDTGTAGVYGDWLGAALAGPRNAAGDPPVVGDVVAGDGLRLMMGQPGVIVQTHGYTHFLVYFPEDANSGNTLDFVQIALENF